MLIIALGVLELFIAAGVIDFRARRRGVRYRGIDARAARDARRINEAQMNTRSNGGIRDAGGGFGGSF